MKSVTLCFLLVIFAFSSCHENVFELIDKSKEGQDILNAIFLQSASEKGLNAGAVNAVIASASTANKKSEEGQKARVARLRKGCARDRRVLKQHVHENRKNQYTVNRHLNSNVHATKKNQQYIDRANAEQNSYSSLKNLLVANRKQWNSFHRGAIQVLNTIIRLLRRALKELVKRHKIHSGSEFIELSGDYVTTLSEVRVDFANSGESFDGLKPIIGSLLQTMSDTAVAGKADIRKRIIRLLRTIIRILKRNRDRLETRNERAQALFESLLQNFKENIIRVSKLLQRLVQEKKHLVARERALKDSLRRARTITRLSKQVLTIRNEQCLSSKKRNARLFVRIQKIKHIVANLKVILHEKGNVHSFFQSRQVKLDPSVRSD
jgi:hypothetical protein